MYFKSIIYGSLWEIEYEKKKFIVMN